MSMRKPLCVLILRSVPLQVLVMDAGRVKEFDTVPALMAQPDSSFRAMVTEAGLTDQS